MELARDAFRRSGTKLKWSGEGAGAGELASAIRDWQNVLRHTKALAHSQRVAAESLMKYSLKQDNAAVKDACFQVNELIGLWGESQTVLCSDLEQSLRHMQSIIESTRLMGRERKALERGKENEAKLKKDLKKAERWKKGGDIRLIQHKISEASSTTEVLVQSLEETKKEQEVVKMFQLRASLGGMADAYARLGTAALEIFSAQKDVVKQIPAVSTQDVSCMTYEGSAITRERVRRAREKLGLGEERGRDGRSRRKSAPPGVMSITPRRDRTDEGTGKYSPPPPYAPTAPPIEDLPNCPTCHRIYPILPPSDAAPPRRPAIMHCVSGGHIVPPLAHSMAYDLSAPSRPGAHTDGPGPLPPYSAVSGMIPVIEGEGPMTEVARGMERLSMPPRRPPKIGSLTQGQFTTP